MKAGLNRITLIGRIGEEPIVRQSPQGTRVASFRIAVPRPATQLQAGGEIDWFNVLAWGDLADQAVDLLGPNEIAYVEGRLQSRTWQDAKGQTHSVTEVVASQIISV